MVQAASRNEGGRVEAELIDARAIGTRSLRYEVLPLGGQRIVGEDFVAGRRQGCLAQPHLERLVWKVESPSGPFPQDMSTRFVVARLIDAGIID